jgi:hypothetical protein
MWLCPPAPLVEPSGRPGGLPRLTRPQRPLRSRGACPLGTPRRNAGDRARIDQESMNCRRGQLAAPYHPSVTAALPRSRTEEPGRLYKHRPLGLVNRGGAVFGNCPTSTVRRFSFQIGSWGVFGVEQGFSGRSVREVIAATCPPDALARRCPPELPGGRPGRLAAHTDAHRGELVSVRSSRVQYLCSRASRAVRRRSVASQQGLRRKPTMHGRGVVSRLGLELSRALHE